MAHFAKVNNGIVEQVLVAEAEFFETFVDSSPGTWIQTSYNTYGGIHYQPNIFPPAPSEDQSKALRKNYASIGYTYDRVRDAFYAPKPYASWTLNEQTCIWEPPTPYPEDATRLQKNYYWDEPTQAWIFLPNPT